MKNELFVFCDGGARGNPGPAAVSFLIKNNQGKVLIKKGKFIGKATNNVAEYQGVIEALKFLSQEFQDKNKIKVFKFYLDSQLIVNQLNGLFKIKNAKLKTLIIEVRGLENQLKAAIYYHYISRKKNYEADKIVNQVLDKLERAA